MIDGNNFSKLYRNLRNKFQPNSSNYFVDDSYSKIFDDVEIVDRFRENFQKKFCNSDTPCDDYPFIKISRMIQDEIHIDMNIIFRALKYFNTNSSQGETFIPKKVLKHCQKGVCK